MKPSFLSGFIPASVVASTFLLAANAHAAWTYAGGTLNTAQTYDGLGVDSALNPRLQGVATDNDYIGNGNGGSGSITVTSGSLTINASDFKVGQGTGSNGTIAVNGGTLNINQIGQWGGGIGMAGTGVLNIAAGAVVNWQTSGSNEQRFMIGNGATGNGTLNLNGGTLNNTLDIAQALNDGERQWRVGSDGGTGTINLNSGTWNLNGALPFFLGGKYQNLNTTPTLAQTGTVAVINITNGSLVQTGIATSTGFSTTGSTFTVGTNDYVNFITGGTGGLSIQGWHSVADPGYAKFRALIDAGKIRRDGVAVTPGNYSAFLFSDDSGKGVLKINNSAVILTQPVNQTKFVGQTATFTATASGSPSPDLLWEVSTDSGNTWNSTGVTTSTLTLPNLTYSMGGRLYHLKATNSQGTAFSNDVALLVSYPNPAISAQPVSVGNATAGSSASMSVTASGVGTLTYKWQKSTDAGSSWSDVPSGGTSATLTFNPVAHSDAALYRCIVTDPAPEADSLPATTVTSNWAYLALTNTSAGFVWAPVNSTMTYDGTGADSGINPYTQVGNDIVIGFGNGSSSLLTVNSGTLSILNVDQWAPKIGKNDTAPFSGNGTVTVNAGATLNLGDTGSGGTGSNNEQRVSIGARANGTLNVNGGTVNVHVGPGTDGGRSFQVGASDSAIHTGTLNLTAGTLNYPSNAPLRIGFEAGAGIVNVQNGNLRVTGTSTVLIGGNDRINFVSGGTGSIAILGWDGVTDPGYTKFKALIDTGKIRRDGVAFTPGDYGSFLFSDDSGKGVLMLGDNPPVVLTQPVNQTAFVGQTATFTATASGSPSPTLLWEVSNDFGDTWTSTGVTTSTLTLTNVTLSMDFSFYRLSATNSHGTVFSEMAPLYVSYADPTISAQPVSVANASAGSSASMFVTASGVGTLTYKWQKSTDAGSNWSDVPSGGTSATLTFNPVVHSDAALYRCIVTDPAPEADSLPATTVTSNWAYLALTNTSAGFVWTPVNSTMTYDGTGADSGINPFTQVGNDIAIGLGNGSSSLLTVSSGTLTILNVDQWSPKIGKNDAAADSGNGTVTVNAGATLNFGDTGSGGNGLNSEQRVTIGGRANGTLNVNGGTVNVYVGPGTDGGRSFQIGSSDSATKTGTLNLTAGTLNYPSNAPLRIGFEAGAGIVNVQNGELRVTGTSTVLIGGNDHINFVSGGTGSISILGWDSVTNPGYAKFKALIDTGKIFIDGAVVPAATYTSFIFSDDSGLGVMKLVPTLPGYPTWAAANGATNQTLDQDHDGDGVKNGVEYFMGQIESTFTANPAPVGGSITWPMSATYTGVYGSDYEVQYSTDLGIWIKADVGTGDNTVVVTAGTSVVYDMPTGGKNFVRLVVRN